MKHYFLVIGFLLLSSLYVLESNADDYNEILTLERNMTEMISEFDFDNALFYIDKILKIDPDNQNALNNKGGILLRAGNYTDAITQFDRVLLNNENNTEALNNKAIALSNQVQYTEALRLFHKSLLLDSSNQIVINNTKNLIEKLYFLDEAEKSFGVVKIKDQGGNIVGYSKISKVLLQPPLGYILLKNEGSVNEIIIDDKKHEILEFSGIIYMYENRFVAKTELYLQIDNLSIIVGELIFNGFIVTAGDTIEYNVIILDPAY